MTGASLPPPSPRPRPSGIASPSLPSSPPPSLPPSLPSPSLPPPPSSAPAAVAAPRWPDAEAWRPVTAPMSAPRGTPSSEGRGAPPPPRSTSAITSLVLALAWIGGIGSVAAIVCGVIGLRATADGRRRGRGVAVAGLTLGLVGVLLTVGAAIAVWSVADETDDGIRPSGYSAIARADEQDAGGQRLPDPR